MIAAPRVSIEDRLRIEDLYSAYVACLDQARYDDWLELFVEDCIYRVVPRENYDRGLPLSTLAFESKGMLRDRIYSVTQTLYHEPYYMRHLVTNYLIAPNEDGFSVQANYLVLRTKSDDFSKPYSTGRYVDTLALEHGGLRFRQKICVFDSELIPNSLIYPL